MSGDNLVSATGAEEDGVDNRMEPPSRAPGDGPDGKPSRDKTASTRASAVKAETAALDDAKVTGTASTNGPVSWPEQLAASSAEDEGAAAGTAHSDVVAPAESSSSPAESVAHVPVADAPIPSEPISPNGQQLDGHPDGHQPQSQAAATPAPPKPAAAPPTAQPYDVFAPPPDAPYGNHGVSPGVPPAAAAAQTAPLPTVAAVAESVRGIATRLGSSFSGLGKLTEKTRPGQAGPTAGSRVPPSPPPRVSRPQATRPQATRPQAMPARSQPRRAQLTLERLEPWSVMKFSFLISLVCWVILFVVVAVLYFTLSKLGVLHAIEKNWSLVTTNKSSHGASTLKAWLSASRILGYTMLIGAVNVVLMTALATIGAVLYNLIAALTGGIEVTLKESD
jgi:hypothetical protein